MSSSLRACVRGAVGAMAMTGLRRITTTLGLVRETPPESVVEEAASGLLARVPAERRPLVIEAAHISYGMGGGVAFGLLPGSMRRAPGSGVVYGIASWLAFDRVIAPVLGLPQATEPKLSERLALLADHILYGLIVAGGSRP